LGFCLLARHREENGVIGTKLLTNGLGATSNTKELLEQTSTGTGFAETKL